MVANSGAVKFRATASPTGKRANALDHKSVPNPDIIPRRMCSLGRLIRKLPNPVPTTNGNINKKPLKDLKNAASKGWTSRVANRIRPAVMAKKQADSTI